MGDLDAHRRLLRRVLLAGVIAGLIGNTIFAGRLLPSAAHGAWLAMGRKLLVEGGKLGLTLAYASALALAYLTIRGRRVVRVLAPLGQMALSWYLLQTVFGIWMFYGFPHGPALMGKLGPASLAALALVGFGTQVLFARVWMSRYRFGPAEWCWRSLTYWEIQPLVLPAMAGRRQYSAGGAQRGGEF